jgi:hypothetical protein
LESYANTTGPAVSAETAASQTDMTFNTKKTVDMVCSLPLHAKDLDSIADTFRRLYWLVES